MTPAEQKAREIYNRFLPYSQGLTDDAIRHHNTKQCALICVNEIMDELKVYESVIHYTSYWSQVKKEIEKL